MPKIYYTAENYKGIYENINTTKEEHILCRKLDLYRSIITVGNPSFFNWKDVRNNGFLRTLSNSIIQKVLLVQANIESNPNEICLHPIFNGYVSDQKRIVSYNLGMAVAKLYAEKLLEIPNLIHVESLKKIDAITFVNKIEKSQEPDLVGMTSNGEWHVFEAKGTSSIYLNGKINEAKEQARQVETIHGINPSTISACATSFTMNKIFSKIVDPKGEKGKEIEIDVEKFYENYYLPFFAIQESSNLISKKSKIDDLEINSFEISTNNLNLTFGLTTEIYELLQEKNFKEINKYYNKNKFRKNDSIRKNRPSIGIDGFILKYTNY